MQERHAKGLHSTHMYAFAAKTQEHLIPVGMLTPLMSG